MRYMHLPDDAGWIRRARHWLHNRYWTFRERLATTFVAPLEKRLQEEKELSGYLAEEWAQAFYEIHIPTKPTREVFFDVADFLDKPENMDLPFMITLIPHPVTPLAAWIPRVWSSSSTKAVDIMRVLEGTGYLCSWREES